MPRGKAAPGGAHSPKAPWLAGVCIAAAHSLWYYLGMAQQLTVELIPDPEVGGFTARVPDIPAYGEGDTEEEAIADLKEALRAYIDAFGLDDALARLNVPTTLRQLDWDLHDLTRPHA